MLVNLKNGEMICLAFANGKKHDFRLFKDSRVHVRAEILLEADTGYQGLVHLHANSLLPKKRSKNHPLTKQQRKENHAISSIRRVCSATSNRLEHKQFGQKYGIIGAREIAKTAEKACT